MPGPSVQNIEITRGSAVVITVTVRDADSDTAPVTDITGWTLATKIKRHDRDPDPSVITPVVALLVPASGTLTVSITAAMSATLTGTYRWSVWRTNALAETCLTKGDLIVRDTTQT